MDVETFIKKWWSEEALDYRPEIRNWMQNSYANPVSFWEDLYVCSQKKFDFISQTILFEKYDFYADCVLRHLGKNILALKSVNEDGQVESWTYDALHAFVDVQVKYWTDNHTLKPGQTVLLFLPQGIHFLVGLLTALRLGLVISIVPIHDRFFAMQKAHSTIDQIKPDLIITIPGQTVSEKWDCLELDLTLQLSTSAPEGSHAYLAGEMVQKHFNPFSEQDRDPILIEATRSYLTPLRDAFLTLNLEPGVSWARPLASTLLEEPSCSLMALLAGATIFYVSDLILLSKPELIKDQKVDILGISPPLQELWIKTSGAPSSKMKFWYRNPLYGNDHSWRAFSQLNHLQKVPAGQLLLDKERGGFKLISQPKTLEKISFLHPSLGSPWKLLKIGKNKDVSTEGFGLFQVEPASTEPHLVIAMVGDEWIVSISMKPLREGIAYPIETVENSVKSLDFLQTCMIIPERHPQHYIHQQFALLVFVSPNAYHTLENTTQEWTQKIQEIIRDQVGEVFIPDHIFFYPIYPKMKEEMPHRHWVESQYKSGALFRKQTRSIYNTLNLLKQSIYEEIAYSSSQ